MSEADEMADAGHRRDANSKHGVGHVGRTPRKLAWLQRRREASNRSPRHHQPLILIRRHIERDGTTAERTPATDQVRAGAIGSAGQFEPNCWLTGCKPNPRSDCCGTQAPQKAHGRAAGDRRTTSRHPLPAGWLFHLLGEHRPLGSFDRLLPRKTAPSRPSVLIRHP